MNNYPLRTILLCCAIVAAACITARGAQTNSVPARPKSVFIDDVAFGRDPFYPGSTRRGSPGVTLQTNAVVLASLPLSLKGISGSTPPYALINGATVSEGEEADIRVGRDLYKVRCKEIRERSVLIEINGTRQHELKLRDGI